MPGLSRHLSWAVMAVGFAVWPTAMRAAQEPVTYTETIAPIIFEHCVSCHRPGADWAR